MSIISPDRIAPTTTLARRLRGSWWLRPWSLLSLTIIAAWAFIAIFAPIISPFDPLKPVGPLLSAPDATHLFGTDELGRDVLSRVLHGAQLSLPLAVIIVAGALAVGGTLGLLAGYLGKASDNLIMRFADLVLAFPQIILAMAVTAAFGPSTTNAVIALIIVSWPVYARIIRSSVLSVRGQEYVIAGRLLGSSTTKSMVKDVVPNSAGPALVMSTIELGQAILLLAALSFLGLGPRPPAPEWGAMIALGSQNLGNWWISIFPGLAIFSLVLAFNMLGDAIQDRLDPSSRAKAAKKR